MIPGIDPKIDVAFRKVFGSEVGWLYNVEMQMLALAALVPRLLYYWSKVYGQQLAEGDDPAQVDPRTTITVSPPARSTAR